MLGLIKRYRELCEQYYEVYKQQIPFELAWQTLDYRIAWLENMLYEKEKGDVNAYKEDK